MERPRTHILIPCGAWHARALLIADTASLLVASTPSALLLRSCDEAMTASTAAGHALDVEILSSTIDLLPSPLLQPPPADATTLSAGHLCVCAGCASLLQRSSSATAGGGAAATATATAELMAGGVSSSSSASGSSAAAASSPGGGERQAGATQPLPCCPLCRTPFREAVLVRF